MAEGKVNIRRSKVLVDHGKVQTCRCCGCSFCSGVAKTFTATSSSIAECACDSVFFGHSSKVSESPDVGPNGVWAVTYSHQFKDICYWNYQETCSAGQVRAYLESGDCTEPYSLLWRFARYNVQFELTPSGPHIIATTRAWYTMERSDATEWVEGWDAGVFYQTNVMRSDCSPPWTFSDNIESCWQVDVFGNATHQDGTFTVEATS